jgi:hypothetical protein
MVLPPGFEPESSARKAEMIDRSTLREPNFQAWMQETVLILWRSNALMVQGSIITLMVINHSCHIPS